MPDVFADARSDGAGVLEVAELRPSGKRRRGEEHQRHGTDHDEHDTDGEIEPFVVEETRRDALVDDVALLKEELPRRDRGADDRDDRKHDHAEIALRQTGDEEVVGRGAERPMRDDEDRHERKTAEAERHREALEAPEVALRCGEHHARSGDGDAGEPRQAEIRECEADADEFGDDRERIEHEQIDHAERAPEFAEAFEDQTRVPDAGHDAEPQNHLLIHVQHGHEEQQRPQEARTVVLSGLRVRAECAGVVIADHHDQTRAEDREKREQFRANADPRADVVLRDRTECAVDIADVHLIERGAALFHHHRYRPYRYQNAGARSMRAIRGVSPYAKFAIRRKKTKTIIVVSPLSI